MHRNEDPDFEKSLATAGTLSEEELVRMITPKVSELLQHQTHRLFTYLYRIDVSEQKVRNVIHHADADVKIAALIISKLREKQYWRAKYSPKSKNNS